MALPPHYPGRDDPFPFHPFNRFPLMGKVELSDLARDIEQQGQIVPITLYDGMILDGRNRYLAIKKLNENLKKPIRLIYGDFGHPSMEMDELARRYLKSLNFYRRAIAFSDPPLISATQLTLLEV